MEWKNIEIPDPRFENDSKYIIKEFRTKKDAVVTVQLAVFKDEINMYVDYISEGHLTKLYFADKNFHDTQESIKAYLFYEVDKKRNWKKTTRKTFLKEDYKDIERQISKLSAYVEG